MARGEARFPRVVEVVSEADALERARAGFTALVDRSAELGCAEAESDWQRIRSTFVGGRRWLEGVEPQARRALAECWVGRALASRERALQVEWLERAREIDHRAPSLRRAAEPLGRKLFEAGKAARDRDDWEEAYRLFSAALRADPSLAWARRHAEEARGQRLAAAAP